MSDLFGNETEPPVQKKRTEPKPNGYAWTPGSGPEGKRCSDCAHSFKAWAAGTYYKCDLTKASHTRGRKTDILIRSPACKFFEQE
jgi:hypothetical protein